MDSIKEEVEEYLSCLVSAELSVRIAEQEGRPVNRALKATCAAMLARIQHKRIHRIFQRLRFQPFPVGALSKMRRELDEAL